MNIRYFVIGKDTSDTELSAAMANFKENLARGKQVAFVVRKGALSFDGKVEYHNDYTLTREEAIRHIVSVSKMDPIVSTTGKASRELFEIREANEEEHGYDFLTVGSMGHSSSIALGIALQKPETTVWCIDGDGAVLMHMGSMAVLGSRKPKNLIHVVINNGAHESVGGLPTVASGVDFVGIAKACGYPYAVCVADETTLDKELLAAKNRGELSFIEIRCAIGSRADLGRPTTTPVENKERVMAHLIQPHRQ